MMKPEIQPSFDIIVQACDTVTADGPNRRAIDNAVEVIKNELLIKKDE